MGLISRVSSRTYRELYLFSKEILFQVNNTYQPHKMPFGLKLGKSDEEKLQEAIFNCRMSSKQLEKAAKKTEPKEAAEKLKCKEYILAGQMDMASIHAQNAIRHRSEGTRNLQMASRLQAAEGRLKHALTMKGVMPKMARATGAMTS